jgi:hypothetical protein
VVTYTSRDCPRHDRISTRLLLDTGTAQVRDVVCDGEWRHRSAAECAGAIHLVFLYRGVYVRHLGCNDAVAEANQLVFFNQAEDYSISHPAAGGDSSLSMTITESLLRELAPKDQMHGGGPLAIRRHRLRLDPRAQVLVALLRHSLRQGAAETSRSAISPSTAGRRR